MYKQVFTTLTGAVTSRGKQQQQQIVHGNNLQQCRCTSVDSNNKTHL